MSHDESNEEEQHVTEAAETTGSDEHSSHESTEPAATTTPDNASLEEPETTGPAMAAGVEPGELTQTAAASGAPHHVPTSTEANAWSAQAVAEADAERRADLEARKFRNRARALAQRRSQALGDPRRISMSVPTLVAMLLATLAVGLLLTRGGGETVVQTPTTEDPAIGEVVAVGTGVAALPAPAAQGVTDPTAPRTCPLPSERTNETDALYNGTDPNRNLLPYSPFRIINYPCANFPGDLRATVVYRDAIVLLQGGAVYRTIPFDASQTVGLKAVVEAVADPDWMVEVAAGVFQLDTALIQLGTTSLEITAPDVTEVRFTDRRDVFLGGRGASVLIDGVTVTSWDANRGGPDLNADDGRAFILYERGSRLDIIDSRIEWLGSDRSGAYGTSWRTGGTTGSTINTVYDNNWFGVYTFEARDIVFRGNTFSNNVYYGLDPHDYSYGLIVEDNVAFGNGSHGLIFSRGVVDSVMRNNHSYDNGGNGIVLDLVSDRNVIENNLVENNKKDGIVLLASGNSQVINNTVRGNRTGIRLNQVGTTDVIIEGNIIDANRVGIHAYGGASGVDITDNLIFNSSRAAIVADAGDVTITRTEIAGAPVGVDARSATDVDTALIRGVDTGLVVRDAGVLEVRNTEIDAAVIGVHLFEGTQVSLATSTDVSAPTEVLVPSRPQAWRTYLPLIGIAIILIAIVLEIVRGARTAGERYRLAPPGVVNIR